MSERRVKGVRGEGEDLFFEGGGGGGGGGGKVCLLVEGKLDFVSCGHGSPCAELCLFWGQFLFAVFTVRHDLVGSSVMYGRHKHCAYEPLELSLMITSNMDSG